MEESPVAPHVVTAVQEHCEVLVGSVDSLHLPIHESYTIRSSLH